MSYYSEKKKAFKNLHEVLTNLKKTQVKISLSWLIIEYSTMFEISKKGIMEQLKLYETAGVIKIEDDEISTNI